MRTEQKKTYAPVIDAARRLSLQPKQALAEKLSHEANELLFGGAAGGGKSEWLIRHCAREMLKYPGNRGVIFRRVFPSLNRKTREPAAQVLAASRQAWTRRLPGGLPSPSAARKRERGDPDERLRELGVPESFPPTPE
jgi:hypothetical protein